MKLKALLFLQAFVLVMFTTSTGIADDGQSPFTAEIYIEIQNDFAYESDDPDAEVNTLSSEIGAGLAYAVNENLSVEASLLIESIQDPDPGEDTEFENHGLYVEELKLAYNDDHFGVFAGKYNPSFGVAWDLAPGIYGTDFAEDYELTERIGFGGYVMFGDDAFGYHTLTANTFFLDTTFLSESLFTSRDETEKSDGGLSNTEDFSSFSATLDSESVFGVDGLNTHLGVRSQSEGDADTGLDRETGYAAAVNYAFPVNETIEADLLLEGTQINNNEGSDDDVSYVTASAGFTIHDNWNVAASYTSRDTDVNAGSDTNDYMFQLSAGYEFDNGFSVDAGYRNSDESGTDTHIAGVLVTYSFSF